MATETVLNKLTINSVANREVYKAMQEKGLINQDELYLVNGDEAGEDYLPNPSGGTAGQLLTKTAEGAEWKDAPSPKTRKVVLTVAGWGSSTKQQTVTCTGVLADATAQKVSVSPVDTSFNSAWNECNIYCIAQATNSITVQCETVPTSAVELYVTMQTVTYETEG